ncbi:MAG: hypothetical protein IPK39_23710 [Sulfuritalea sp.]|nr:hypothetical protein [Sulfuritalea sp.]
MNFTTIRIENYQSTRNLSPATIRLFDDCARQNIEFSVAWFDNLQQTVFTNDGEYATASPS